MVNTTVFIVCIFATYFLKRSVACNGYQLHTNYIRNCNPNNIIKVQNFKVTLNDKCEIVPTGCVSIVKQFGTAQVHSVFSKLPLPSFEVDEDLCTALQDPKDPLHQIFEVFQVPQHCPINKQKVCGASDKKVSITKYRNRLSLIAGNITIKADFKHNNGVSCLDMSLLLNRPRQG